MAEKTNETRRTGRRKTSIATVVMHPGEGKFVVNGKPMTEYFRGCVRFQNQVLAPFVVTNAANKFDATVKVLGGGPSSQAGAIRHAFSRALSMLTEDNKKALKKAGYLTRDSRMVERKKPGQPKARRRYQYSKR